MRKNEKLFLAFGDIDQSYIEEAGRKNLNRKNRWVRFSAMAACIAIAVLSLGLWMLLPFATSPKDVSRYEGSEYYQVIQKINLANFTPPKYKNRLEKLINSFGATAMDGAAMPEASDKGENYQEITDNQVASVIEGDLIKRTDKHIFYLDEGELKVFSIGGEESRMVGSIKLSASRQVLGYDRTAEFFLSKDGETVTVILPYYTKNSGSFYDVISLDVSRPEEISEINRVTVMGDYTSSRLIDGAMMVFSSFWVKSDPNFGDESDFIPQIDKGHGFESIKKENIISPDKLTSTRYSVALLLSDDGLQLIDSIAFLSYAEDLYVSESAIYATRSFSDTETDNKLEIHKTKTQISVMAYDENGFIDKGSLDIEGYVKDRFSLDEYKGDLRVVTTSSIWYSYNQGYDYEAMPISGTSANLYIIDAEDLSIRASVMRFAPIGETVRSVRFDREAAYVCTAIELKDPVFFFDLSDIDNITYKETGTIEGYSTSLINMGNGILIGIGVGDTTSTLKIEAYEEMNNGVVSIDSYRILNAGYSEEYKSYYIDRENGFIGLGVTEFSGDYSKTEYYLVLHFNGYRLNEMIYTPVKGASHFKRSVYIDGYFYIFGSDDFQVIEVPGN